MSEPGILSIYKASAGSGKTHALTGEYLKMAFRNENSFKHILAVTFTNKSTTEMRERILRAISELANGEKSDYRESLCKEFKLSPDELQKKAERLLNRMLNQYSYFKVSTIDSFFQQVVKSLVYELKLDSGFAIELDDASVIDNAVSRMIDDFGIDSEEGQWIMQSINDKIDKGKSWKIQEEISELAKKAFDEIGEKIDSQNDGNFNNQTAEDNRLKEFSAFKDELKGIVKAFVKKVNDVSSQALAIMDSHHLEPIEFSGTTRSFVIKFVKFSQPDENIVSNETITKTMRDACDDEDKWYSKSSPRKNDILACVNGGLRQKMIDLVALYDGEDYILFNTARVTLNNLNKLALVHKVLKIQREICREQNLFLLRSTMPLLDKMIGGSDTPFIYEKIGNQLNHFMIDEFQDTSTLNWNNFLPLVKNGIDSNNGSLIVGDVKQAIYRWRGGDWDLLDHVVQKEQFNGQSMALSLQKNWRSCRNIVHFNNWCFVSLSEIMGDYIAQMADCGCYDKSYYDQFVHTYSDARQEVAKEDTEGFVSVDFIEADKADNYDALACEWVVSQIDRLSELGFQPGDIAILVRSNKKGTLIANRLARAQGENPQNADRYRFVSNESVLLGNNQGIRLLISALQFLLTPTDKHTQGQLIWLYFAKTEGIDKASEKIQQIPLGQDAELVMNQLPAGFAELNDSFRQLDLVQLCSRLIQVFFGYQIDQSDLPFINEFEDRVQTFNERYGSNLQQFIDWWNDSGFSQAIAMNDKQNAISITSIHKSKGLEFKAVLLPFNNPSQSHNDDILWCRTQLEPYCKFSPIPVSYSSALASTLFSKDYYKEQFMRHVDNLNVLYVAFTRASVDMRICTMVKPKSDNKKDNKSQIDLADTKLLEMLFDRYANGTATCTGDKENPSGGDLANLYGIKFDVENKRITIGSEREYVSDIKDDTVLDAVPLVPKPNSPKICISHHTSDFFSGADFDQIKRINTGKLYHHIFENVKYADDVAEAVSVVAREGLVTTEEMPEFVSKVKGFVAKQPDWFSNRWTVLTEQSIMLENGDIKRPDRILESDTEMVVIDYKFTSRHDEKYNEQVSIYVDALRKLTDKTVKGYLWYVWPNETVEVCG